MAEASVKTILLEKLRGSLAALAVGDALGALHEFTQSKKDYTGQIHRPFHVFSQWQGTKTMALGQVTDDTEMTLALTRSLIRNQGYNRDAIILEYQKWAAIPGGIGINTAALFRGVKTVKGYESRFAKLFGPGTDPNTWTQSNGALMRCSPLAFLPTEKALIDCKLSNPHPVTVEVNRIYLTVLKAAYEGRTPEEMLKIGEDLATEAPIKEVFQQLRDGTKRDLGEKKGWAVHALYAALYALKHCKTISETYDWVIGQNLKGDTDTLGAIAGALMGAHLGYERLLQEPIFLENWHKVLTCDTTKGDRPMPPEYTLRDFDQLTSDFIGIFIKDVKLES